MTPNEVKQAIIEYSNQHGLNLLESAIAIADSLDIDIDEIAKHINGSLKEMMQVQCEAIGLLKKDNNSSFVFE